MVKVDYPVSTFDYGIDNHHHNIRTSTGIVIRF
jgi:hypothetical protein